MAFLSVWLGIGEGEREREEDWSLLAEWKVMTYVVLPGFPLPQHGRCSLCAQEGEQSKRSRRLVVCHLPILSQDILCSFCIPEKAHRGASTTEVRVYRRNLPV